MSGTPFELSGVELSDVELSDAELSGVELSTTAETCGFEAVMMVGLLGCGVSSGAWSSAVC